MKKSFILIILLWAVIPANAQSLNADEIIKECNCKTFDCVNEFLAGKNFHLYFQNDSSVFHIATYAFSGDADLLERYPDAVRADDVSVSFYNYNRPYKHTTNSVSFTTSSNAYFLVLKKNFLSKGFKFIEEHSDEDIAKSLYKGVASSYSSQAFPELLLKISTLHHNFKGNQYTDYKFEVEKQK